MSGRWKDLIVLMIQNLPDPNERLPLSNRRETVLGTTITFLVTYPSVFFLLNTDRLYRFLLFLLRVFDFMFVFLWCESPVGMMCLFFYQL